MHAGDWAEFQRRLEIGHPLPGAIAAAVNWNAGAGAQIEIQALGVEYQGTHAAAIDPEEVAAINEVRQRQRVESAVD